MTRFLMLCAAASTLAAVPAQAETRIYACQTTTFFDSTTGYSDATPGLHRPIIYVLKSDFAGSYTLTVNGEPDTTSRIEVNNTGIAIYWGDENEKMDTLMVIDDTSPTEAKSFFTYWDLRKNPIRSLSSFDDCTRTVDKD
jgi:hypothetical protein